MTILKSYPEKMTPVTQYKLTRNKTNRSMRDLDGYVGTPIAYALYSDENNNGEVSEILAVEFVDEDGNKVTAATNSEIFKRDFFEIVEMFENNLPQLVILSGVSAKKRTYVSVGLA